MQKLYFHRYYISPVISYFLYLLIYQFIHRNGYIVHNLTDILSGIEDAMTETISMVLDCHLTIVMLTGNKSCNCQMQLSMSINIQSFIEEDN